MMEPQLTIAPLETWTSHGPLVALGYLWQRWDWWSPVYSRVTFPPPTHCDHPVAALLDLWVGLLAGCEVVAQVNTRLRPDPVLAQAWGRPLFYEQSTIARVLEACTPVQVAQLRAATTSLYHWLGQAPRHTGATPLDIDIDLTGLFASARADGSTKGYFSGHRNAYGRQLVRIGATAYREVIASLLYPGSWLSLPTLQPAIGALEEHLQLTTAAQRAGIRIRLDGGFGTDDNLRWLLPRHYAVCAKGFSGKRAMAQAQRVTEWQVLQPDQRWAAWSPRPLQFPVPTRTAVIRWRGAQGRFRHALSLTTDLDATLAEMVQTYDTRGAAEVELQTDHAGLHLRRRRNQSGAAQEVLGLLNDLAHNWLAWLYAWVLRDHRFAGLGPQRLVRDVLSIPAQVTVVDGQLAALQLQATHPHAANMAAALTALWKMGDRQC